ncbi:HalOD1 output domain-containing protein [Halobaculum marinum]|uniref:HalOD1 output domain-containing protein n=1 Tax=Halobaculum marinum TaxID=3031996 RepID=A0ABD5WX04_9EURY|nr:HalOD1 output domain-containing protein [Halobaculum sp. DT55]
MSVKQVSQRTTVVRTAEDDICLAVISAVAEARGVRPTELDAPLYDAVDPDALQRLFPCDGQESGADVSVQFTWAGCSVSVYGPGHVSVDSESTR